MNYKDLHIKALIKACKKKDQNAQMELYQRYHQPLYKAAFTILKNRDDAQDAMQEGMIKAFEKLDQYKGEGDFGGWIHTIVVRQSISYYHKNKIFVGETHLHNHDQLMENPEDEEGDLIFSAEELDRALDQLNARYNLILKLYFLEGYTHEEIGELLNWSPTTCRTTLSRAKKKLKQILIHERTTAKGII